MKKFIFFFSMYDLEDKCWLLVLMSYCSSFVLYDFVAVINNIVWRILLYI